MSEKDPIESAKKQAAAEGGFYKHLITYVVICGFITIVNLVTSPGVYWFYWPILGWGIGVFWHAVGVFAFQDFFGTGWEEKRAKKILKKRGYEDKAAE